MEQGKRGGGEEVRRGGGKRGGGEEGRRGGREEVRRGGVRGEEGREFEGVLGEWWRKGNTTLVFDLIIFFIIFTVTEHCF